ncbi:MAG: hypothetical protein M3040_04635 [Bacteroidota bacterium]|nr:hypothetical protein [Bacteroidota bacterium]
MKNVLLPILFVLLVSNVFSQALYSSTTYTSRFNPGLGSLGTPVVAYDDVAIPTAIAAGSDSISITKIKVGIRRAPNAPATNVNLYYTTFQNDSSPAASHIFIGKISLPVNTGALVTSVIAFGDSVTPLFKIKAGASAGNSGTQKFLIGASFDNPSPANGIILSRDAHDNLDSIWIDNADNDKAIYATNFNSRMPATYYLEVFGGTSGKQMKDERNQYLDVAVNKGAAASTAK